MIFSFPITSQILAVLAFGKEDVMARTSTKSFNFCRLNIHAFMQHSDDLQFGIRITIENLVFADGT